MNYKSTKSIFLTILFFVFPFAIFSMGDPLEDNTSFVDDSMIGRMHEQYLDQGEDSDDQYEIDDNDDQMLPEEDYEEDYEEDDGDVYPDQELPEQDYGFEIRQMAPQQEVNEQDGFM